MKMKILAWLSQHPSIEDHSTDREDLCYEKGCIYSGTIREESEEDREDRIGEFPCEGIQWIHRRTLPIRELTLEECLLGNRPDTESKRCDRSDERSRNTREGDDERRDDIVDAILPLECPICTKSLDESPCDSKSCRCKYMTQRLREWDRPGRPECRHEGRIEVMNWLIDRIARDRGKTQLPESYIGTKSHDRFSEVGEDTETDHLWDEWEPEEYLERCESERHCPDKCRDREGELEHRAHSSLIVAIFPFLAELSERIIEQCGIVPTVEWSRESLEHCTDHEDHPSPSECEEEDRSDRTHLSDEECPSSPDPIREYSRRDFEDGGCDRRDREYPECERIRACHLCKIENRYRIVDAEIEAEIEPRKKGDVSLDFHQDYLMDSKVVRSSFSSISTLIIFGFST